MYEDDELMEEKSFKSHDEDSFDNLDEPLDPLEEADLGIEEDLESY